ncbi:MAG: winged helix-turn-helix domain-containing protein [Thermoanaerobaculia bacterium]
MNDTASDRFRVGKWTVVPAANEIRHASGRHERLEARAMDVLVLLIHEAGAVVSPDALLDRVWGGRAVSGHSVAVVISDLRKALGDDPKNPCWIETVPKRGYRWVGPTPVAQGRGAGPAPARRRRAVLAIAAAAALLVGGGLVVLGLRARESSSTAGPPSPAELERLFLARQLWSRRDDDGVHRAIELLDEVLAEDPSSAAAHAALAMIYAHKTGEHLGLPALDTFREAQRHLDRAQALDSGLADVEIARALLEFFRDQQPAKAASTLERALAIDPESALAWQERAMVASALGRHTESLRAIGRAGELDPVSESIAWDRVWFLHLAGDGEAARTALVAATRTGGRNLLYEALIAQQLGEERRALDLWIERAALRGYALPDAEDVRNAATASVRAGYAELMRQAESRASFAEYAGVRALWRLEAGDPDAAAALLLAAPPSRDHWMVMWLRELPALAPLRDRPEIVELARRCGLVPEPGTAAS